VGIPLNVLILEDNPTDAELLVIELTMAGFDPEWTRVDDESDFRAGLLDAPDVVLADYHLPQFDAVAALAAAVKLAPEIPVIVVSGMMSEETCVQCLRLGAVDYLLKDRLTRLGPAVRHALDVRETEAARRTAEQVAQAATAILQDLVDGSPALSYLTDEQGRFVLVNRAFEAAVGVGRDRLVGTAAAGLPALPAVRDMTERDRRCLVSRAVEEAEEILPGEKGPRTFVSIRYPMSLADGTPAVGAVYTDISRQKEVETALRDAKTDLREQAAVLADANAELQKLDALRSQFIATVSHELRTPLTSILGFTQVLADEDLPSSTADMVRIIDRNGKRLLDLIEQLLSFASIEGGALRLRIGDVDVADLVRSCCIAVQPSVPSGLTVKVEMPDELPVLRADRQQMDRVLLNLLSNAVKFSPDGGTVTITVEVAGDGDNVSITVRDTGMGIPEDEVKHVFTRFFRSSTTEHRAIGGTGLGLAICKAIVDNHGGRIGVRSEPGEGTTVTVTFPTAGPQVSDMPRPRARMRTR
jgi:PAS domain S-box-containing protein